MTEDRIQAWIDEQPVVNVSITGRAHRACAGENQTVGALRLRIVRHEGRIAKIEYRLLKLAVECPAAPILPLQVVVRFLRIRQRPVAGSYSSFLPARWATSPSSICSIIDPE